VEPVAARLREGRSQVVELACSIPPAAWTRPSPNPGWTCKDLLAHLAAGDWAVQTGLRAVVAHERLDLAQLRRDVDTANARLVGERAGRSIEELIAEVEAEGEETQALLARLEESDEQYTWENAPMTLGDFLPQFSQHDLYHLNQLRTALEV
jgi:uncharacterized protein (TIGR03083 family)